MNCIECNKATHCSKCNALLCRKTELLYCQIIGHYNFNDDLYCVDCWTKKEKLMNVKTYKDATFKAFQCGVADYTLMKTQKVLTESYGSDLDVPVGYQGETIFEAYLNGMNKKN